MALSQEAGQALLDAIQTISKSQMNNISFDETIVCTIVDDSHAKQEFYYVVSDGAIRFKAYVLSPDNTQYRIDDQVYVKVPKGDYTQQKIIEGYCLNGNNENLPNSYISPLNSFIEISKLLTISENEEIEGEEKKDTYINDGFTANLTKETLIGSWTISNSEFSDQEGTSLYDALGLSAKFITRFTSSPIIQGNYGIKLEIVSKVPNMDMSVTTKVFKLDSSEMIGNPYQFNFEHEQGKMFDISTLDTIETIRLYFYQDNNFYYTNDDKTEVLPITGEPNIFIKDVQLSFGLDISKRDDNSLILYSLDNKIYNKNEHTNETNQKELNFIWVNKDDQGKYIGFSDGNNLVDGEKYDEIDYLRLSEKNNNLLRQIGKNTPSDENGLDVSYSVEEGEKIFNSIYSILNSELSNVLNTFKNRVKEIVFKTSQDNRDVEGVTNAEEYFDKKITIVNEFTSKFETDYKALIEWYKGALGAAANIEQIINERSQKIQESIYSQIDVLLDELRNDNIVRYWVTGTECKNSIDMSKSVNTYEIIGNDAGDAYDNFYKDGLFLDLKNEIDDNYSEFKGIYDIYMNRIINIINKLSSKFEKVEKLLRYKETKITSSSDQDDINNSEYKYTLSTLITPYEGEDYSAYDNKYCIYWYRYKPGCKNTKLYQNLPDENGEVRPEEERWFDVEGLIDDEWIRIGYYDNYYQHPEYFYNNYTKENYGRILQSSIKDDYLIKDGLETKREEVKGEMTDVIFPQYYSDLGLPNINDNNKFEEKPDNSSLINIYLDPETKQEKFKIVLYYNHEKFESNELVFTNLHANEVIDPILQETMSDVIITHGANSQDSYQTFYSDNNVLINSTQVYTNREIKIDTTDSTRITKEDLINSWIYWYIPKANTMLTFDTNKLTETIYDNGEITNNPFFTNYYQTVKIIGNIKSHRGPGNFYNEVKDYETNSIFYIYGEKDGWYSLTPEFLIGNGGEWIEKDSNKLKVVTGGVVTGILNEEGYVCFYKRIKSLNEDDFNFFYKIKDYYSSDAINNTILCKIINEEKGISHETFITFTFGTQGNSGTDFSLHIIPINNSYYKIEENSLIIDYKITAYNHINEEIKITNDSNNILSNPSISWIGPSIYETTFNDSQEENGVYIDRFTAKEKSGVFDSGYDYINNVCGGIAKLNVKYNNSEDERPANNLTTYCTIPWTSGDYYIEGPNSIIYDSLGKNPIYYKQPYRIFDRNTNKEIINVSWKIVYFTYTTGNSTLPNQIFFFNDQQALKVYNVNKVPPFSETNIPDDIKFYSKCMPTIDQNNKLIPLNMYISDQETDYLKVVPVVQCFDGTKLLWAQPIHIYQDKYPNQLINDWNGKFEINEENGTIFSTMVAAGYKGSDNTYYGVVMGDLQASAGSNAMNSYGKKDGIGIYGFNNGVQSFGFNIDGTAFLGKSGAGRIEFDGNGGTIKSANYNSYNEGMLIDLDDGLIDIQGPVNEQSIIITDNEGNELTDAVLQQEYSKALGKHIDSWIKKENPDIDDGSKEYQHILDEQRNLILGHYPTYIDYLKGGFNDLPGLKVKTQKSSITINAKPVQNSPYFQITSDNGNNLLYIANKDYFLQSDNYSNNDNNTFIIDGFVSESYIPFDSDEEGWACVDKGDYYYYYWKNEYNNKYTNISLYGTYTKNPSTNQITFNDPYTFNSADPTLGKDPVTWDLVKNKSTGKYYYYLMAGDKSYNNTTLIDQGKDKRIKNVQYSGTRVDLNNGEINAYDLILLSNNILFNSSKKNLPYLIIQSNDYKQLIHISDNNYFLQSNNYDDSFLNIKDGMRIDLYNKYIKTKNVQISTSNPYFLIKDNNSDVELVKFGTDAMFIQSPKYKSNTTGMRINLLTGNIDTKRIKIYSQESYDSKWLEDNATCFAVKDESSNNLIYIGNTTDFYLQSRNYTLTEKSSKEITEGLKIDLDDGSIKSKNFILNSETGFSATVCGGSYSNIIFAAGIKGTNSTSGKYNYAFGIQSGGGVIISHGKIGKWTLANDGYFTSNHTNDSTIYYSRFMPSSDYDNIIVIGSTSSLPSSTTGAQFIVDKQGILHTNSTNYKGWNLYSTYLGTGTWSSSGTKTECFYLASQGDEWIAPSDTSYSASPWMRAYNTSGNIVFQLDRDGKANLKYLKIDNFTYTYSSGANAESHSCELDFTTSSSAWTAIGVGAKYTSTLGTMHAFTVTRQGAAHIKSGTIGGQWISNIAQTTAVYSGESDKNVKNSISLFEDKYENLFDNLKPCKYKYNHGTSNRYHTGFIAQEVVEAIENADLTTQDFAGVIKLKEPNDNGCEWLLRRDEFVALNTWQIQKLKSRISELENEILKIKGEKGLC